MSRYEVAERSGQWFDKKAKPGAKKAVNPKLKKETIRDLNPGKTSGQVKGGGGMRHRIGGTGITTE